ncbi:MAG TPA: hypothetical protein VES79_11215 [Solirubrobacteraceae bacterium]|nr:hypothetical protein [Solirubrobacteraceae bacterium]
MRPRAWRLLIAACSALAALSLLGPSEPTYDPYAWIIWGREITELDLSTVSGPSWKPLPVLFTTPFALFGDHAAPSLWLLVARGGGLLAIAMAYRLGARFAGLPAGLLAGGSLLLADEFVRSFWRGNSEGLLVALCLWAVERHLDGRRGDAFLLGFGAALLRPEVWPFFGLYGLWLAWRGEAGAGRAKAEPGTWRRLLVVASFLLVAVLWFVPEWWGSGDPLRAASRARHPNPDSAAFAAHPFFEVFLRSSAVLSLPVLIGCLVGFVAAARERRFGVRLALGLVAAMLMIAVAAMTEAGFAGNLRYVALPAALVCVLSGVGWVELVRGARARLGAPAAGVLAVVLVAASASFVIADVRELRASTSHMRSEANFYSTLPAVIAKSGGAARVKACGTVFTGPFQVQAVAWYLHMHGGDVGIDAVPPGITFAPRYSALSRDARFPKLTETSKWVVGRNCAR